MNRLKRFFFAFAWLLLTAGVILTSAGAFIFYQQSSTTVIAATDQAGAGVAVERSGERSEPRGEVKGVQTQFQTGDARPAIVAAFLERYNSPLQPYDEYGQLFVEIADQEGIDFRLLPAIAMQESNLCKRIPPGSYSCLGFGVHSRGTLGFESYEANFRRAARELKANYINQGLTTPSKIMSKYTPSSNGSWANSVNQWMAEMRYNDRDAGREKKQDGSVLEFVE